MLLALVISCGAPSIPITEKVTVPTNMQDAGTSAVVTKPVTSADGWREGPGGFPVPPDADEGHSPGRKIDVTFIIPRNRDVVHEQVVKYMATKGYALDSEVMAMGGYRMEIHNAAGRKYSVSVTENDSMTTLMTITAN